MTKHWFVASTKPKQERYAAKNLRAQRYSVELPLRFTVLTEGRKITAIPALRFPGYLFVRFDSDLEEHGPVNNTRGIGELLLDASGDPEPLHDGVIQSLRDIETDDYLLASDSKEAVGIRPGSMVMIDSKTSPAYGHIGLLLSVQRGIASVLEGKIKWRVSEIDLRIVPPEKAL